MGAWLLDDVNPPHQEKILKFSIDSMTPIGSSVKFMVSILIQIASGCFESYYFRQKLTTKFLQSHN